MGHDQSFNQSKHLTGEPQEMRVTKIRKGVEVEGVKMHSPVCLPACLQGIITMITVIIAEGVSTGYQNQFSMSDGDRDSTDRLFQGPRLRSISFILLTSVICPSTTPLFSFPPMHTRTWHTFRYHGGWFAPCFEVCGSWIAPNTTTRYMFQRCEILKKCGL